MRDEEMQVTEGDRKRVENNSKDLRVQHEEKYLRDREALFLRALSKLLPVGLREIRRF